MRAVIKISSAFALVVALSACDVDPMVDVDSAVDSDAGPATDSGMMSADSGADDDASPGTGTDARVDAGGTTETDADAPGRMPIIVGVGWQGLRVLSIDEGQTWCEVAIMTDGHDDLFRGAGYYDGLFVGAHAGLNNDGAIWTTPNGYEWTALHQTNDEPSLPPNPTGSWYGGAAYGNGTWVAGGGCGYVAVSTDGTAWESVGRYHGPSGCIHIRSMAFSDGEFVLGSDDGDWYGSTDGRTWSLHTAGAGSFVVTLESGLSGNLGGRRTYQGRGVCLVGLGSPGYGIERSTAADCSGATRVGETPHRVTTFLFGEAPIADFEPGRVPATLASCLGI